MAAHEKAGQRVYLGKVGGVFVGFSREREELFLGMSSHWFKQFGFGQRGRERQLGAKVAC